jgi:hypothetical protein
MWSSICCIQKVHFFFIVLTPIWLGYAEVVGAVNLEVINKVIYGVKDQGPEVLVKNAT